MSYRCLCGKTIHVIHDIFAGEKICRKCGVVVSSGITERNEVSYVSNTQILGRPQGRHQKIVRQLETVLDKIYASDAIKGYAISMSKRIVRGSLCTKCDRRALAVAVTMIACKMHGKVIDLCDIIENTSKKKIHRIYKGLIFDLKINLNNPAYAKSIITKICSVLKLRGLFRDILQHADATMASPDATGINPRCIVGYCVYRATKRRTTLKAISHVLSVSISCISKVRRVYR